MTKTDAPNGWLEDFAHTGSKDVGVIFVHGFTGSPASMRPWAHYFMDREYTVRVPRLPGHARKWQDLNQTQWQEWPAKVAHELKQLRKECHQVFIFGLSMGGCTTLNVAENNKVDGLVLVNPMIHIPGIKIHFAPLIARIQPGMPAVGDDIKKPNTTEWAYHKLPTKGVIQLNKMLKATRSDLHKVIVPTLLFHSAEDHVLPVSNTEIVMAGIASPQKERVELMKSYHVATMDNDAEIIFQKSESFVEKLVNPV